MTVAGNSSRRGAKSGPKKPRSVGSGGKGKAKLTGKGPTPKAEDRPYHPAAKAKVRAQKAAKSGGRGAGAAATRSGKVASKSTGGRVTRTTPGGRSASTSRASTTAGRGSRATGPRKPTAEVISGRNAVSEALQAGVPADVVYVQSGLDADDRVRAIVQECRTRRLQLLEVSRTDLDRMTSHMAHQGVAARVPAYTYREFSTLLSGGRTLIVAVDGLTDPRNLGAVIRSAAAFGATGVAIPERRAAGVTASAWKTSAGAAARVPVSQVTNLVRALKEAQEAGCFVVGLAGDGAQSIAEAAAEFFDGPAVIVVGSEGAGLSRLVRQTCDVVARIDITSATESLNASVATSIALYEASRARASAAKRS